MRLIDADVLQKKFEGLKEKDGHATGRNAYDLCAMLTEDAPTIDAVSVVRCSKCRYLQDNNGGYPHDECRWGKDETPDADDFCSYGERSSDGC